MKILVSAVLVIVTGWAGGHLIGWFEPDSLEAHASKILESWLKSANDSTSVEIRDMRQAAESGLAYGCRAEGRYVHQGFDYSEFF